MNDIFICKLDFDTYARELAIPVSISCRFGNCGNDIISSHRIFHRPKINLLTSDKSFYVFKGTVRIDAER